MSAMKGFTLLEVLITMIVLAIGLLGLASLQSKVQIAQVESYQRAQAVLLLEDMMARMNANRNQAKDNLYVTGPGNPLGYGDAQPANCGNAPGFAQDRCEWSNVLKGASEKEGTNNVGAMIGARGCIELVQTYNETAGICQPGIYRVTVAWQGLTTTSAPPAGLACAQGLYGDNDAYRRVVTGQVVIATNNCN